MADQKISQLTSYTSAIGGDLLPIVDVTNSATKQITKDNLGIPQSVHLTADLASTTSTTLGNTTGLSFSVTSGVYYRFKFGVVYRSAITTTGFKVSVTIPSATIFSAIARIPQTTDGTGGAWHGAITSSADAVTSSSTPVANTDFLAEVEGLLLPSASGTLQLQHATEVSASGVTVRQGSYGMLWKLP